MALAKSGGRTLLVDLDQLRDSITEKTILISLMYANNEIGVIQPLAEIAEICQRRGVRLTLLNYPGATIVTAADNGSGSTGVSLHS